MLKNAVTLKDLSQELGISMSTISRALKNHPDVSEKTKKAVKSLAKKKNYIPNFTAQSLRNRYSKTIGVIIPKLILDHSYRIINGMLVTSRELGYQLIISETGHSYELEKEILNNMIHIGVDGILVSLSNNSRDVNHIIDAQEKCPLILYDKVSEKVACTKITVEDELGAYNAVMHLLKQGRKKILYINGAENSLSAELRKRGYINALRKSGIEIDQELIQRCTNVTIEEGKEITLRMIGEKKYFDAIFAVTDNVGIGAIQALKEKNIQIPKEVAVIGFSNSRNTTIIEPNLSSVDQPGYSIGMHAVKYLVELIQKTEAERDVLDNFTIELKTGLKIRASSKT